MLHYRSTSDTPADVQAAFGLKSVEDAKPEDERDVLDPDTVALTAEKTEKGDAAAGSEIKTGEEAPVVEKVEKQAKGDKRRDSQARISDLSTKNKGLAAALEAEKARASTLAAELAAAKAAKNGTTTETATAEPKVETKAVEKVEEEDADAKPASVEPMLADFVGENAYDEWTAAVRKWDREEAKREARLIVKADRVERAKASEAGQAEAAKIATMQGHIQTARETLPKDFDTVLTEAAKTLPVSPVFNDAIHDSAEVGQILYHFAKNPDAYKALIAKSPLAMAKEIGRLEATFAAPVTESEEGDEGDEGEEVVEEVADTTVAAIPRASAAMETVRAGGSSAGKTKMEDLPPAVYRARRHEQLRKKRFG